MIVAITGSSGFLGSALASSLRTDGHRVIALVRREPRPGEDALRWDPASGTIAPLTSSLADAVVHLAGESVFGVRWTAAKKRRIRESRVASTRRLTGTLVRLAKPPAVLVCASGVNCYGSNRGDELLTEDSPRGSGFLAEVGREWEAASAAAIARGVRVVNLRFGVVLGAGGGALATMLTPFRLGLGGVIGGGAQWMSWIALDDAIGAIRHALTADVLRGPVNAVAPTPVTNAEFTRTLGRVLGRPTILPVPAVAARLALGEMADELLLGSLRVVPSRLQASGYRFRQPTLEGALRAALGR